MSKRNVLLVYCLIVGLQLSKISIAVAAKKEKNSNNINNSINTDLLFNKTYKHTDLSSNLEVINTQRNISMNDDDQVYKDYYISGGLDAGIKENMVLKVVREVIVAKNGKYKDGIKMIIPVALLKIIYVQPHMAIARLHTTADLSKIPTTEAQGVFVGDKIDLEGSFIENVEQKDQPKDSSHIALQQ